MSHKHAHLMRSIFQDPPSANIHWREIESLLHHLGADVESAHGAQQHLQPDGHQGATRRTDPRRGHAVVLRRKITQARQAVATFDKQP